MPSPRKRKLKYAVGAVLRGNPAYGGPGAWTPEQKAALKDRLRGHNDTQQDITDGTTGADLVRAVKETLAHDPAFGGNKHKAGNFVDGTKRYIDPRGGTTRIFNGLVNDLSDLDMCAYASFTYSDGDGDDVGTDRPQLGFAIVLRDAQGTVGRFVFGLAEAADGAEPGRAQNNGDEIVRDVTVADPEAILPADGFPNNFDVTGNNAGGALGARRYLVAVEADDEVQDAWISFCYAVNASPLRINAYVSARIAQGNAGNATAGRVHLSQLDPGPDGNTVLFKTLQPGSADQLAAADCRNVIRSAGTNLQGGADVNTLNDAEFLSQQIFTGGVRAQDALCFYGQMHRGGGDAADLEPGPFSDVNHPSGVPGNFEVPAVLDSDGNAMSVITAQHGICFLSNPMASALNIAAQPAGAITSQTTAGCGNLERIIIAPHYAALANGNLIRGSSPSNPGPNRNHLHVKAIAALAPLAPGNLEYTLSIANGDNLSADALLETGTNGDPINDGALGVAAERVIMGSSLQQAAVQGDPNFGVGAPTSPIQVVVDGDQYLAIRSNVRQPDALDGDGSRIGLASNFRPVGGGIIVHWHLSVTDPV